MSAVAGKALTSSNLQSHFELFGLPPAFGLDGAALEKAYREIQSRVHPDRFAQAGDAERRASLQLTTRVNEAYRVLKDPVQRAKHLLELQGVDVAFETNTQMPTASRCSCGAGDMPGSEICSSATTRSPRTPHLLLHQALPETSAS